MSGFHIVCLVTGMFVIATLQYLIFVFSHRLHWFDGRFYGSMVYCFTGHIIIRIFSILFPDVLAKFCYVSIFVMIE